MVGHNVVCFQKSKSRTHAGRGSLAQKVTASRPRFSLPILRRCVLKYLMGCGGRGEEGARAIDCVSFLVACTGKLQHAAGLTLKPSTVVQFGPKEVK